MPRVSLQRNAPKKRKTGGRKKGTPNKVTTSMKQAVVEAFDALGGVEAMTSWARQNKTQFYTKIVPKLIPLQLTGEAGGPIQIVIAPEEASV